MLCLSNVIKPTSNVIKPTSSASKLHYAAAVSNSFEILEDETLSNESSNDISIQDSAESINNMTINTGTQPDTHPNQNTRTKQDEGKKDHNISTSAQRSQDQQDTLLIGDSMTKNINNDKLSYAAKAKTVCKTHIKKLIIARDNLKRKAIITKLETDWDNYKKARNETNNLLRQTKKEYYSNKIATEKQDPKAAWKTINTLLGKQNQRTKVNELNLNGIKLTSPDEISEGFNTFFSNIGPNLAEEISTPGCHSKDFLDKTNSEFTAFQSVTVSHVCLLLRELSGENDVKCGVPQGSILGPLFFLLYINDLPACLSKTKPRLFADDTNITAAGECLSDLEDAVNSDLEMLRKWLMANKLSLNVAKTEFQIIGTKQMLKKASVQQLKIHIQNIPIKQVFQCKTLGVTVDENLCWKSNTDNICKKISSGIYALKSIKEYVDQKTLVSSWNLEDPLND
ncbi:Hypothetical predicted protein [Paramuricea clavata]|uniref:Reverse transcriptase domain-containing protein n=1 Tax=Paramuricea clavata TaxID=317549 RepID=A0A7D9ITL7_PARCT|nr:Hypothetical predicted protein [Paramuricea clavata]